jgi:SET domain-containing protein
LVTFYPADFAEYYPKGNGGVGRHMTARCPSPRITQKYGSSFNEERKDDTYKFTIDPHHAIIGHPSFTSDPNYLGHMINDSVSCSSDPRSIAVYDKVVAVRSNCEARHIANMYVVIVAIKDIVAGSELFLRYGSNYWKCRTANKPV